MTDTCSLRWIFVFFMITMMRIGKVAYEYNIGSSPYIITFLITVCVVRVKGKQWERNAFFSVSFHKANKFTCFLLLFKLRSAFQNVFVVITWHWKMTPSAKRWFRLTRKHYLALSWLSAIYKELDCKLFTMTEFCIQFPFY